MLKALYGGSAGRSVQKDIRRSGEGVGPMEATRGREEQHGGSVGSAVEELVDEYVEEGGEIWVKPESKRRRMVREQEGLAREARYVPDEPGYGEKEVGKRGGATEEEADTQGSDEEEGDSARADRRAPRDVIHGDFLAYRPTDTPLFVSGADLHAHGYSGWSPAQKELFWRGWSARWAGWATGEMGI